MGARPRKPANPGVEISADVRAARLRFEKVPETGVRFWGSPGCASVSGTRRENLPEKVERDVVYRDARIRLKIAGGIADVGEQENRRSK